MLRLQFLDNRQAPVWLTDERLTIGQDSGTAANLATMGAQHTPTQPGTDAAVNLEGYISITPMRADLTAPGTAVEVEVFGTRYPAVVQEDAPLWDAKNERIRA